MKKSLIALLLVVALVVTVSVFAVSAETDNPFDGQTGQFDEVCPHCGGEAVKWAPIPADTSTQIQNWSAFKDSGVTHFYLAKNSKTGSGTTVTEETFCINLNGYEWDRKTAGKFFTVSGGTVNIMDTSVNKTGAMNISPAGAVNHITVNSGTVNQYGGKLYRTAEAAAIDGGCMNMTGGTYNMFGGSMIGKTTKNGGAAYVKDATFNVSGGTLVGNASYGGTVYIAGSAAANKESTKLVLSGSASLGSEDTQSTATTGGAIYANANCYVNIQGGTIQNCKATGSGGAISFNSLSVTFNMSDGMIKNCQAAANGGAILFQVAAPTQITGGTIQNCSAVCGGAIAMTKNVPTVNFGGSAKILKCTATGTGGQNGGGAVYNTSGTFKMTGGTIEECSARAGGAVFVSGSAQKITMSGGTINKCSATTMGGGIYIQYMSRLSEISGGTIESCTAPSGGNIAVTGSSGSTPADVSKGPKLKVSGGTITAGVATASGGNVFIDSNDGTTAFEMTGGTISNGKAQAAVSPNPAGGTNIYAANMASLIINGDAVISGGSGYTSVSLNSNKGGGDRKMELGGNASVNYIHFVGWPNDGYSLASVTVKEDFTGNAKFVWHATTLEQDGSLTKADYRKAGTILASNVTAEENYDNAGTIYVLDNSSSQKAVAYFDTNADQTKELATTGMVGVDADGVEHAITAMPTDDTYAYVKLYGEGMTVELTQNAVVDVNNMDAHFVTGDNKLTVVNYRNTSTTVNASDKYFTVDNAENLVNLTVAGRNPVTNAQYIIIPEADNKYSAHQVKVDINMVSVRPKTASMYYTTKIAANAKVAPYAKSYGVILSLVDLPGANFLDDDSNQDGKLDNIRTEIDLNETAAFAYETNSALLTGILIQDAPEGQNKAWGEMPVYANAYVRFEVNGEDIYVMADETADYSLKEIMEKVNEDPVLAANEIVIEMYTTWSDPLASWGLDKIAANAAPAA